MAPAGGFRGGMGGPAREFYRALEGRAGRAEAGRAAAEAESEALRCAGSCAHRVRPRPSPPQPFPTSSLVPTPRRCACCRNDSERPRGVGRLTSGSRTIELSFGRFVTRSVSSARAS